MSIFKRFTILFFTVTMVSIFPLLLKLYQILGQGVTISVYQNTFKKL